MQVVSKSVKFREIDKDFLASDKTFSFMNPIIGTPAY